MTTRPLPRVDERLLTAIAHPLRHRILLALDDRVASPKQVAADLGEPIGRVSHHFRRLVRLGAIELVRTVQRRGAVEHFYRARLPAFDGQPAQSSALPADVADHVGAIRSMASAGGLDHLRAHVSYTLLDLDAERVDDVARILDDALARVEAVRTESARRLARAKEEAPVRSRLAVLYFERA